MLSNNSFTYTFSRLRILVLFILLSLDLIKELKSIGYTDDDIIYEEIKDGRHNFVTWSKIFPQFLLWAFAKKKAAV